MNGIRSKWVFSSTGTYLGIHLVVTRFFIPSNLFLWVLRVLLSLFPCYLVWIEDCFSRRLNIAERYCWVIIIYSWLIVFSPPLFFLCAQTRLTKKPFFQELSHLRIVISLFGWLIQFIIHWTTSLCPADQFPIISDIFKPKFDTSIYGCVSVCVHVCFVAWCQSSVHTSVSTCAKWIGIVNHNQTWISVSPHYDTP